MELHETNIAQRIEVIIEHFRTTVMSELGGMAKAMVITASRVSAVVLTWSKPDSYYLHSDWKGTWDKEGGGSIYVSCA